MKKEVKKKREISNWWYWILIMVFILFILSQLGGSDYKECVERCTYLYDSSCYCYGDGRYDCSDDISELKYCIRACD